MEQVIDNRIEMAFVTGFYPRPELGHKLVRREHLICIILTDHRLAQRKMVQMSELKAEPFVMVAGRP